jgi:hypothetical protein
MHWAALPGCADQDGLNRATQPAVGIGLVSRFGGLRDPITDIGIA